MSGQGVKYRRGRSGPAYDSLPTTTAYANLGLADYNFKMCMGLTFALFILIGMLIASIVSVIYAISALNQANLLSSQIEDRVLNYTVSDTNITLTMAAGYAVSLSIADEAVFGPDAEIIFRCNSTANNTISCRTVDGQSGLGTERFGVDVLGVEEKIAFPNDTYMEYDSSDSSMHLGGDWVVDYNVTGAALGSWIEATCPASSEYPTLSNMVELLGLFLCNASTVTLNPDSINIEGSITSDFRVKENIIIADETSGDQAILFSIGDGNLRVMTNSSSGKTIFLTGVQFDGSVVFGSGGNITGGIPIFTGDITFMGTGQSITSDNCDLRVEAAEIGGCNSSQQVSFTSPVNLTEGIDGDVSLDGSITITGDANVQTNIIVDGNLTIGGNVIGFSPVLDSIVVTGNSSFASGSEIYFSGFMAYFYSPVAVHTTFSFLNTSSIMMQEGSSITASGGASMSWVGGTVNLSPGYLNLAADNLYIDTSKNITCPSAIPTDGGCIDECPTYFESSSCNLPLYSTEVTKNILMVGGNGNVFRLGTDSFGNKIQSFSVYSENDANLWTESDIYLYAGSVSDFIYTRGIIRGNALRIYEFDPGASNERSRWALYVDSDYVCIFADCTANPSGSTTPPSTTTTTSPANTTTTATPTPTTTPP